MPLLRNDDLVRIDLPADGEWVDVKRHLSRGDQVAVQRASVQGAVLTRAVLTGGVSDVQMDAGAAIEAAEFAALEIAIRAWSFDVPVTPEAIRSLDGDSIDAIKVRLNELYAPRTDDERKNSVGPTPMHSSREEGQETTPINREGLYPLSSAG